MGRELFERFPKRAEGFFIRARETLGFDLQRLMFEGPEEELKLTENAQPAILLDSVIKYELLRERVKPDVAVGHSLGEYSALVCAGVLMLEDALVLVRRRGQYMQEAVPVGRGAMVAVLKLEAAIVKEICRETGAEIANLNAPGQVVISGARGAVMKAKSLAEERGGRGIELDVSAPFHSSLMAPAEKHLKRDLEHIEFRPAVFPVISTVSGEPETDPERIRELLMRQITSQIRWVEYVKRLKELGVKRCIEIGPGEVLTRLIRRIDRELEALAFAAAFSA
jgi:[acyl-carrier-protein] S-malonyltransferase